MIALPDIGILQGRLTPSRDGRLQFFPVGEWEAEFSKAREIGFAALEPLVAHDTYREHPLWTEEGTERLLGLAAETGVRLPSVHGFFKWRNRAEESVAALRAILPRVRAIGAKTVLISLFDENAVKDRDDEKRVIEIFRPLADEAGRHGIALGLESEIPAGEFKRFAAAFGHPAVGIYYDIGNMVSMGVDVPAEIRMLGPLIVGVHVKDRTVGGGTVPLGAGAANFPEIFKALRDIGYSGSFIIQGARDAGRDDVELSREYYQKVRQWRDLAWA